VYEKTIIYFKKQLNAEEYAYNEIAVNSLAGLLGGVLGSALTNSFETITVAK